MTEAEKRLWTELRRRRLLGCKFRRQQPLGAYIVDFVCLSARLIVEPMAGSMLATSPTTNVVTDGS